MDSEAASPAASMWSQWYTFGHPEAFVGAKRWTERHATLYKGHFINIPPRDIILRMTESQLRTSQVFIYNIVDIVLLANPHVLLNAPRI